MNRWWNLDGAGHNPTRRTWPCTPRYGVEEGVLNKATREVKELEHWLGGRDRRITVTGGLMEAAFSLKKAREA
jgi:hypothetical protein